MFGKTRARRGDRHRRVVSTSALLPRSVVLDLSGDDEQGHKNQGDDGTDEIGYPWVKFMFP